jgi:uncharacterized protein (TIGR03435 family)
LFCTQPAVFVSADGRHVIEFGSVVRSDKDGGMLFLADGSRAEMRSESEFSLENAADGVEIRLIRGSIIVNAAKQRSGHLYVQTHDVIVSVVGTVFLVNAEEAGSRVAVIEGEVRVQLGAESKQLRRGEQVSTSQLETAPIPEEISWSKEAVEHVARLEQDAATVPNPVKPPRLVFDTASVRPVASPSVMVPGRRAVTHQSIEPAGIACRGVDGSRVGLGPGVFVGGDRTEVYPVKAPQGRCIAKFGRITDMVEFAYGTRQVTFAPGVATLGRNVFEVSAVAENPSTATAGQLIEMFRNLLEDRFKLSVHTAKREVPGYSLRIAKDGFKGKESPGPENAPHLPHVNLNGQFAIWGISTLGRLGQALVTGSTPVVNATGLSGIYEYDIVFSSPGVGRQAAEIPFRNEDRVPVINAALEPQMGLRLVEEKSIAVDTIIIDHVEQPSPN